VAEFQFRRFVSFVLSPSRPSSHCTTLAHNYPSFSIREPSSTVSPPAILPFPWTLELYSTQSTALSDVLASALYLAPVHPRDSFLLQCSNCYLTVASAGTCFLSARPKHPDSPFKLDRIISKEFSGPLNCSPLLVPRASPPTITDISTAYHPQRMYSGSSLHFSSFHNHNVHVAEQLEFIFQAQVP
jgi:hypothetical protein